MTLEPRDKEAKATKVARERLKLMFDIMGYDIEEDKPYYSTNNIGEPIFPPYQADLYLKSEFILELDPPEVHTKSRRKIKKDEWRDSNLHNQFDDIKTVRLIPRHVNKQNIFEILAEIHNQLREKKYHVSKNKTPLI